MVKRSSRKKAPTLKSLIKRLDALFSEFVRRRDSDKHSGVSYCRTCGSTGRWQDFQCGHWIKRFYLGTRWREENCTTQCGICNGYRRGAQEEHAAYIAKTYGAPMLEELVLAKQGVHRITRAELQSKIEHYQNRIADLT